MSDQNTDALNGKRPFEDRVFARFDALDSALRDLDSRVLGLDVRDKATNSRRQKLDIRAYDPEPIWQQVVKEIVETRRELSKRLDRIYAMALETRADLRDVEHRLDKIERKPVQ